MRNMLDKSGVDRLSSIFCFGSAILGFGSWMQILSRLAWNHVSHLGSSEAQI